MYIFLIKDVSLELGLQEMSFHRERASVKCKLIPSSVSEHVQSTYPTSEEPHSLTLLRIPQSQTAKRLHWTKIPKVVELLLRPLHFFLAPNNNHEKVPYPQTSRESSVPRT